MSKRTCPQQRKVPAGASWRRELRRSTTPWPPTPEGVVRPFRRLQPLWTRTGEAESVEKKKSGVLRPAKRRKRVAPRGATRPRWVVRYAIRAARIYIRLYRMRIASFQARFNFHVMHNIIYYVTDVSVVVSATNDLLHSRTKNDGLDLG